MKIPSLTVYTLIGLLAFCMLPSISARKHMRRNIERNSTRCGRGRFYNETLQDCRTCNICGPGSSVKIRCKNNRDTKCEKCPVSSFSTSYTHMPARCRTCTNCGIRPTKKNCTSKSDTICGPCPLGMYWDSFDYACVQCSYCFRDIYKDSLKAPACGISQIPASHRCYQMLWPPYNPPHLLKRENENGVYFVSSLSSTPESTTSDVAQSKTALEATSYNDPIIQVSVERKLPLNISLEIACIFIFILCTLAVTITTIRRCPTSSAKPQYKQHIYKRFHDGKSRWKSHVGDDEESKCPLTAV